MGGHSSVAFALTWPERVAKLVLMGGGTGGMSLFTPMPSEGIKLLNGLYREPTLENLKRNLPADLTESLPDTVEELQEQMAAMLRDDLKTDFDALRPGETTEQGASRRTLVAEFDHDLSRNM